MTIPASPARRIWMGCLASHNAGVLFGQWIDLDDLTDLEDLTAAVLVMLAGSPEPGAEEWFLGDHEGFATLQLDRHEDLATLWVLHEAFATHCDEGGMPPRVLAYLLSTDDRARDDAERIDALTESWAGTWEPGELARERHEHTLPGWLLSHIDWTGIERSWIAGGLLSEVTLWVDGKVERHLFDA